MNGLCLKEEKLLFALFFSLVVRLGVPGNRSASRFIPGGTLPKTAPEEKKSAEVSKASTFNQISK